MGVVYAIEKAIPVRPSTYAASISTIYERVGNFDTDAYDDTCRPLQQRTVDPDVIVQNTGRDWKPWSNKLGDIGRIQDGDWDLREPEVPPIDQPYGKQFQEMPRYKSLERHFVDGVPWEETMLYEKLMRLVESDTVEMTRSGIQTQLEAFDRLFETIQQNGYRSQLELSTKSDTYLGAVLDEVLVDIGRDGQLLFVDGRHRLSIAKILGIDEIPVTVLVRHQQWVDTHAVPEGST